MNKYDKLLGFVLKDYAKNEAELKQFCITYRESDLQKDLKLKLNLALEIAKDINNLPIESGKEKITSTEQMARYFQNRIAFSPVEKFEVCYLDKNFKFLDTRTEFSGSTSSSLVAPREIIKTCLELENVKYVITAHNHPSGSNEYSPEDQSMHERLGNSLKSIGVERLDDLIVTHSQYSSISTELNLEYFERWDKAKNNNQDVSIDREQGQLTSKNIEIIKTRGSINILSLEEKISALTEINTSKIKGVFDNKQINELGITKAAKEKLETIESFAKQINKLLQTNTYQNTTIIRDSERMARESEFILKEEEETIGIVFLNARNQVIGNKVLKSMTTDELVKEITLESVKANAISVCVTDWGKDNFIKNGKLIKSILFDLQRELKYTGINVLDYIRFGQDNFYTGAGEREVYQKPLETQNMQITKENNVNVVEKAINRQSRIELEL